MPLKAQQSQIKLTPEMIAFWNLYKDTIKVIVFELIIQLKNFTQTEEGEKLND